MDKPKGGFLLGTSPEFEIGLYTAGLILSGNKKSIILWFRQQKLNLTRWIFENLNINEKFQVDVMPKFLSTFEIINLKWRSTVNQVDSYLHFASRNKSS